MISCNGFGKKMRYYQFNAIVTDYEYYYIDHFFCKSTEEFIQKIQRQDAMTIKDTRERKIKRYFKYNKITKEKIEYSQLKYFSFIITKPESLFFWRALFKNNLKLIENIRTINQNW